PTAPALLRFLAQLRLGAVGHVARPAVGHERGGSEDTHAQGVGRAAGGLEVEPGERSGMNSCSRNELLLSSSLFLSTESRSGLWSVGPPLKGGGPDRTNRCLWSGWSERTNSGPDRTNRTLSAGGHGPGPVKFREPLVRDDVRRAGTWAALHVSALLK